MKHLRTPFCLAIAATLVLIAELSKTDMSAAVNASPTVSIVRLPNVKGETWPGDFNGDGFTDLVIDGNAAISGNDVITVLLGDGHGNFTAAPTTGAQVRGVVHGVGDFNNDGRLDAIVDIRSTPSSISLNILPGMGNGTFGAPISVDAASGAAFVLSADLDGDGNRDLVAGDFDSDQIRLFRGHGNFQFDPAGTLTAGLTPNGGILADFNGDGRRDLAIANLDGNSVSVFKNNGAFTFTAADIPLDRHASDATAADVNGDGKLDLIVSGAGGTLSGTFGQEFTDGVAYVLAGHGDGTFAAPVSYPVARGAYQIVVGDFTRDGILDIATGNRSTLYRDDCGRGAKTWDSISILPGNGNGTFAAASSFSVGNQLSVDGTAFRNTLSSLNTSDIDADGATDLIVSNGVIFKNRPTDPNWAPTVTATSTEPGGGDHSIIIRAPASDVDQDMLTYSWTDSGGSPIPPLPNYCFTPINFGVHTFTVTVDDQHGHTASSSVTVDFGSGSGGTPPAITIAAPTGDEVVAAGVPYTIRWTATAGSVPIDHIAVEFSPDDGAHYRFVPGCSNLPASATSCVWNDPDPPTETARIFILALSTPGGPSGSRTTDPFTIRAGSTGGTLPAPWQQQGVGAAGAAGSATYSNGVFTVAGSGADIWGTADEFEFAYVTGDYPVSSSEPGWFEITTRVDSVQNVNPWTKAGLMIREGLGASARHASLFVTPGKGIAFQRRTATGGTSVSTSGPLLTAPVWLKLGVNGPTITAYYRKNLTDPWTVVAHEVFGPEFDQTAVGLAVSSHVDATVASASFSNVDVHYEPQLRSVDVGTTGGTTASDFVITSLTASGADIWGTSDHFRFAFENFDAVSGSMTARVRTVQNVNAWTKAGVMFREGANAAAVAGDGKYVFVMATPGKGISMQYRTATGGSAALVGTIADSAPGWVRLTKDHNTYSGFWSKDGVTWLAFGSVSIQMDPARTHVGLALTSHSTAAATASFDDLVIARQP